MKDLHRAVDAMHHPYQYSDLELERALEAIQQSPLKQFYNITRICTSVSWNAKRTIGVYQRNWDISAAKE